MYTLSQTASLYRLYATHSSYTIALPSLKLCFASRVELLFNVKSCFILYLLNLSSSIMKFIIKYWQILLSLFQVAKFLNCQLMWKVPAHCWQCHPWPNVPGLCREDSWASHGEHSSRWWSPSVSASLPASRFLLEFLPSFLSMADSNMKM